MSQMLFKVKIFFEFSEPWQKGQNEDIFLLGLICPCVKRAKTKAFENEDVTNLEDVAGK